MTEETKETGMVPAAEAAKAMQTTVLSVMMHIKRKLLEGQEIDGSWYVSTESLTAFLAENEGKTKPVVCQTGCAAKKGGCSSCG